MEESDLALNSDSQEQAVQEQADTWQKYDHKTLTEFEFSLAMKEEPTESNFAQHALEPRQGESVIFLQNSAKTYLETRIRAAIDRSWPLNQSSLKYLLIEERDQELMAMEVFAEENSIQFSPLYTVLLEEESRQNTVFFFSGAFVAAECSLLKTNNQNCLAVSSVHLEPIVIRELRYSAPCKVLVLRMAAVDRVKLEQIVELHQPTVLVLFLQRELENGIYQASILEKEFGFQLVFAPYSDSLEATPEFPNTYETQDGRRYQNPAQFTAGEAEFLAIDYPFTRLKERFIARNSRNEDTLARTAPTTSEAKIVIKSIIEEEPEEEVEEMGDQIQDLLDRRIISNDIKENGQLQEEMFKQGYDEKRILSFILALAQEHAIPFVPPHLPMNYSYDLTLREFNFLILQTDFALPLQRIDDLFVMGCGSLSGVVPSYGVIELTGSSVKCQVIGLV